MPRSPRPSALWLALALAACGAPASDKSTEAAVIDADQDGVPAGEDCDDADPAVAPGQEERCDGLDNDCDGEVDEDVGQLWYADEDGDGFGADEAGLAACAPPEGRVPNTGDCDDDDDAVYPGNRERCDGIDNDCDGLPDPTSCRPLETADAILVGDREAGGFGDALLALPDPRGGAAGLVLVGAPGHSAGLAGAGRVYAFAGPLSGTLDPTAAVAVAEGDAVDAAVGAALALADDIDGDGIPEVLLSAWGDPRGGGAAGAVHVLGAEQFLAGSVALDEALFGVHGDAPGDSAGLGVAALGDMDGDGRTELLVGAPNAEGPDGATSAGLAAVVSGASAGFSRLSTARARIHGAAAGDTIGLVVAGPGDLDGDGLPDLVLGSPYDDRGGRDAGAVFAFLGPVSGSLSTDDADAILTGEAEGDAAGAALAGGADLDGDGTRDLLVGATDMDAGGEDAGAAYVVTAAPAAWSGLGGVEDRLIGRNPGDKAGNALAVLADADGDGAADVLVGAYIDDSAALNAGAAYLVFGPVGGTELLADADGGFIGAAEGDLAGWTVASGGDLDGDGRDEVLVGARRADLGATDGGAVYLLHGAGL